MSNFAQIENSVVVDVIVAEQDVINTMNGTWVQTSYNTVGGKHTLGGTPLRGNYAGVGYTYDAKNDVFYQPQPFPSWTLNTTTWNWDCPVPQPVDGKIYHWNENNQVWDVVATPTSIEVLP